MNSLTKPDYESKTLSQNGLQAKYEKQLGNSKPHINSTNKAGLEGILPGLLFLMA